jgi:hypothetical protein
MYGCGSVCCASGSQYGIIKKVHVSLLNEAAVIAYCSALSINSSVYGGFATDRPVNWTEYASWVVPKNSSCLKAVNALINCWNLLKGEQKRSVLTPIFLKTG